MEPSGFAAAAQPFASPVPAPAMAPPMTEASPLAPTGETVLVLSTHAKFGRYISTVTSSLFLLGFHGALIAIGWLNWAVPCDAPLAAFLLAAGALGVCATILHVYLELKKTRDEAMLLPTEAKPAPSATHKLLVIVLLGLGVGVVGTGSALYLSAPNCAYTSPIVYNWSLAALLLYGCFASLIALVPLLAALFPLLSIAMLPMIAALVTLANWMSEAGKRGAYGAVSALYRWLRRGGVDGAHQPPDTSLPHPQSPFALYANTAGTMWLFGFMALETLRSWQLPCDAPLHTFVLGAACLGLVLALTDFIADVFRDPMPPLTKQEQSAAKDERRRKLSLYTYVLMLILVWGSMGMLWLRSSETCAHTAPGVYRLALLLELVWGLLVSLLGLAAAALAVDFCLSGKLRMVVILEQ